ncbi:MAG: DUF2924 domain-containing protein [Phycisphaeraceae bacterium]|nr:DUF2924 domain-containing protein [Phycisphaeraceae bacterium]
MRNVKSRVHKDLAALEAMGTRELRERYEQVFGEAARSSNRRWLQRRIAWRIQVLAEGDLAARTVERTRAKAATMARDADLRVRLPSSPDDAGGALRTVVGTVSPGRDERVPPPGAVLVRVFKGREHRVTVRATGFEYRGDLYRSLSAVAHAISGSHWNGFHFFGLSKPQMNRGAGKEPA